MATGTWLPLMFLNRGETASVAEVTGDEGFVHRLAELGLRPGAVVTMLQPGEPCIVALDGQRLSVRAEGDFEVLVELCAPRAGGRA